MKTRLDTQQAAHVDPQFLPDGEHSFTTRGAQVRWRRDGKELFYIALDDRLMAAPIRLGSNSPTLEPGASVPLFATHIGGAVGQIAFSQNYMVSPDGQRFLMNTMIEETASPITVLLNWKAKP